MITSNPTLRRIPTERIACHVDPQLGAVVTRRAVHPAEDWTHMVHALRAITGHHNVEQYLTHSRDPWTLTTAQVTATRSLWSLADAATALRVLVDSPTHRIPTAGYRIHTRQETELAAVRSGAVRAPRHLQPLIEEAVTYLAGIPQDELLVQHCDPRPDAWVLTASGPVLTGFHAVAAAPVGWDAGVFLAHLDAHPPVVSALAASVGLDWGMIRAVTAWQLGLAHYARVHGYDRQRAWAVRHLSSFVALLDHVPARSRSSIPLAAAA